MPDIRRELVHLVGSQLTVAGYAGSMRTFGFGPIVERQATRGIALRTPFGIHVDGAWRLTQGDRIVTGFDDWFNPPVGFDRVENDWVPEKHGNLQTIVLAELFKDKAYDGRALRNRSTELFVLSVEADVFRGCSIRLSPDFVLTIFPTSLHSEAWRLIDFQNGVHTVIGGEADSEIDAEDVEAGAGTS